MDGQDAVKMTSLSVKKGHDKVWGSSVGVIEKFFGLPYFAWLRRYNWAVETDVKPTSLDLKKIKTI